MEDRLDACLVVLRETFRSARSSGLDLALKNEANANRQQSDPSTGIMVNVKGENTKK